MQKILLNFFILISLSSQAIKAEEIELAHHLWNERILLIFSSKHNPLLLQQNELFDDLQDGLRERDMIIYQIDDSGSVHINGRLIEDLETTSLYKKLKVDRADFTIILIGKDGTEKLRQYEPITEEKLFPFIDAMPMRQQEMLEDARH